MDDLIELLADDAVVQPERALAACELLAPVISRTPADAEAVDAAAEIIGRMSEPSLVAAVLDWWLIVTTGHKSANGQAYQLPDEIGGQVRDTMEMLRDHTGDIPAAEWARASAERTERIAKLDGWLDLDSHGAVKLPQERPVWNELVATLEPDLKAIRAGRVDRVVELDEARLCKEMKQADIEERSRRWTLMLKRAAELVVELNDIARLNDKVASTATGAGPALVETPPPELTAALDPLGRLLLRPILAPEALSILDDDVPDVLRRIEAAATATDAIGRYRLADIVDSWLEATGSHCPVLEEELRELGGLRQRMRALRDAGVDADEAELLLLDYDLEGARQTLDRLEHDQQTRTLKGQLQQRFGAFEQRVRELGLDDDAQWLQRLAVIVERAEAGDPSGAETELGELVAELNAAARSSRIDHARRQLAELVSLGLPTTVLAEFDSELTPYIAGDESGSVPEDLVAELDERVERHRRDLADDASDLAVSIRGVLADPDHLPADLRLELEPVTRELADVEAQRWTSTDQAVAVVARARELFGRAERHRVQQWRAEDGEHMLIGHVVAYCQDRMDLDETDIRRLYVAVKTKPFVIIAGLTGSGKSTVARLLAESMGATAANGQFRRVAVRPDWIDQSEVLGFVNPTSQRFEPGWLAELVRNCERQPDRLHVALLDEMNLAPVEQYLAEVLSAMEEARAGADDVHLPLYTPGAQPANAADWPHQLRFPPNLVLIGTVNVDETTRPLSERVIDRANVLQLTTRWSTRHHDNQTPTVAPLLVPFHQFRAVCAPTPSDAHHDFLVDLAHVLQEVGIGVGLRAHIELERFLANAEQVLDDEDALDLGILQRLIPKVRGFKRDVGPALAEMRDELDGVGCRRCVAVLDRWLDDKVSDDEFLDGTDARVGLASPV